MDPHQVVSKVDVTDLSHSQDSNSISWPGPRPARLPISDHSQTTPLSPHSDQWWSGKYDFAAKVIVLGDYGVGKSSLLSTLGGLKDMNWCRCTSFRPNEYVEIECVKDQRKILIRVMDTGGQERFRSMTSSYFRGAHGCLLMFNVTNEESFSNITHWFHDLSVYAPADNISSMVVGAITSSSQERRVSAERAFRLAEDLDLTYCETDVKDEEMVLWILTRLVNSVIVSRVRRQSLAITIMPSFKVSQPEKEKKRWKCCSTT